MYHLDVQKARGVYHVIKAMPYKPSFKLEAVQDVLGQFYGPELPGVQFVVS
jgi:hypothetical protein